MCRLFDQPRYISRSCPHHAAVALPSPPLLSSAGSTISATSTAAPSNASAMPSLTRCRLQREPRDELAGIVPRAAGAAREARAQASAVRGRCRDPVHEGESRERSIPLRPRPEVRRDHLVRKRSLRRSHSGDASVRLDAGGSRSPARRTRRRCRAAPGSWRAGRRPAAGLRGGGRGAGSASSLSGSTNSAWMARPSLRKKTNWSPSGNRRSTMVAAKRRDHILVDRALERPGAHLRREAPLQQELQRRGFPFHRPGAVLEAAPLQHAAQFLLQDDAHQIARQRAEHDDLVEPVLEFRPDRSG